MAKSKLSPRSVSVVLKQLKSVRKKVQCLQIFLKARIYNNQLEPEKISKGQPEISCVFVILVGHSKMASML